MRISVQNKLQDISVHTIAISRNPKDPENVLLLRCYFCGEALDKIQGKIVSITPGIVPTEQTLILSTCGNCKTPYVLQSVVSKAQVVNLILFAPDQARSFFFCVICRTPLLEYNKQAIALLPERKLIQLPHQFSCIRPTCQQQYNLLDIVV